MRRKHWAHYTPLVAGFVSCTLASWKGIAWWSSNSLAVQASLIDSLLDACTSFINFWAIHTTLKPADACHRYGHDKAEALASLAQASLMVALSGYVMWGAISSLTLSESHLAVTDESLNMMAISTFVALGLVIMQTIAIKRVRSLALQTDVLHYRIDVITNAGVFLTLWLGYVWLDGLVALFLSAYLFKGAWHLIHQAGHILMDGELDNATRERILQVVLSHHQVRSVNQLRTRFSGHTEFIQLNVVLDKNLQLHEAHTIAHELEDIIQKDQPSIQRDITIHQEPLE